MSVNAGDRKESKIEFDNTYFRVHDDAVLLIGNSFGADKDMRELHKNYIALSSKKILDIVMDIGTNIRIANYNCYKSWRNGIIKDCNKCYKTILAMDRLYKDLFPEHLKKKKLGRNELIMEAYREYKEEYGKCLKNGNYRIIGIVDTIVN